MHKTAFLPRGRSHLTSPCCSKSEDLSGGKEKGMLEAPATQALGRGKEDRDEREGRGERGRSLSSVTNGQCFNQSCPCNEASINPQRGRVQRVFRLVNTWRLERVVCLERAWKFLSLSPCLVLCISSIWLFLSNPFLFLSISFSNKTGDQVSKMFL